MGGASPDDPLALAISVLAATVSEPRRAQRLLDLTGIGPSELRARADDPVLLCAVLNFLESHEPDLVAVAHEVGVEPARLVAVRRQIEEG